MGAFRFRRWPTVSELLLFIAEDFSEDDVAAFRATVTRMRTTLKWGGAKPVFVDETDAEEELRTVGAALSLPGRTMGTSERDAFHSAERLIEAARGGSAECQLDFELELDGVFVGDIEAGTLSRTLREGLLDPWRSRIAGLG